MARPSEYDFEMCKLICDDVANGMNIKKVLESKEEYPTWTSFRRWKNDNEELSSLYVRSIQDKAEMVDSEIDDIMNEVKSEKISFQVGTVLINTLKWKAAKYYPKMFGERNQTDFTTNGKDMQTVNIINLGEGTPPKEK